MSTTPASLPREWRYGLYPDAPGKRIVALGRVDLPIGEALRLEMEDDSGAEDVVHVQIYISTTAGEWALWLSCPRGDLAANEAALRTLTSPDLTS